MTEQILEGTWEEIAQHASEFSGRRIRVTLIDEPRPPKRNEAMLEALDKVRERGKNMSVSPGSDTLRIIREGRAGKMWGYEPTE